MAQETHYYNNVIAQLVELRKDMTSQGESNQESLNKKFNEVIEAIKKIQVTADNIKVEAGTINLSTDEVEELLRTVNTNLGIINDNLDQFDTNIKTELTAFSDAVKDEFSNLSTFLTTTLTQLTTDIGNNNTTLINKLESNRVDLNTNMKTNTDSIVEIVTTNTTTLKKSIEDASKTITDGSNDTLDYFKSKIEDFPHVLGGPPLNFFEVLINYLTGSSCDGKYQLGIGNLLSSMSAHNTTFHDLSTIHMMNIDGATTNALPKLDSIIAAINNNFGGTSGTPPVEGSIAYILTDILSKLNGQINPGTISAQTVSISKLVENLVENDNGYYNMRTSQLNTHHTALIEKLTAINTTDNTNAQSIIDAINAIKVTAESIKIDAGTINLSTDEVEDLLKNSNTKLDSIIAAIIPADPINESTIIDILNNILNNSNSNSEFIVNNIKSEFTKLKDNDNTNKQNIVERVQSLETKFDTLLTKMDTLITAVNNITDNGAYKVVMVENTPPPPVIFRCDTGDWIDRDTTDEMIIVRPYDDSLLSGIGYHLRKNPGAGTFPCKTTQIAICYSNHGKYEDIPFRLVVTDKLGNKLEEVDKNGIWTIIEMGNVINCIINIYE